MRHASCMMHNKWKKNPFCQCMMKRIFYFLLTIMLCVACSDDEQFTTSSSDLLTLPDDTLKMDTVFSGRSSATYTFWVHNRNSKALRIQNVRLRDANKGFRINVDGEYLNPTISGVEVLGGDSLLVFVELTAPEAGQLEPIPVDEELHFTLESGAEQLVKLRAWTWDAERWVDKTVSADETVATDKPILVTGTLVIEEGATLRLEGTTLYFHDDASLVVRGTLEAEGVTLRGDRLDRMFDYLPYDHISGQWQGVRVRENARLSMTDCDLHAAYIGLTAVEGSEVQLTRTVIHNSAGDDIFATGASLVLDHCLLSNAEGSLLSAEKCNVVLSHCTLAQYYPFALRDIALSLGEATTHSIEKLLIGGYEEALMSYSEGVEKITEEAYHIAEKEDFVLIDEDNLIYDFHLKPDTKSAGFGCYE